MDGIVLKSAKLNSVSLSTLSAVLTDIVYSADEYRQARVEFHSATGSLLGRVEDALTDPSFTLELSGRAIPTPASLWLFALGSLSLAGISHRRRR